jgi:hypothetical protein
MWVGNSGYVVKVRPLFVGFALGLLSPVGISLFEEVSFSFVVWKSARKALQIPKNLMVWCKCFFWFVIKFDWLLLMNLN